MSFNVIIAGSRSFRDYNKLKTKCDALFANKKPTVIISGGAPGADTLGQVYATERKIPCIIMPPNWDNLGEKAGYVRNEEMLEKADALVALWDGQSSGTAHMIQISRRKEIPVKIVFFNNNSIEGS